jgi:hypothetical protein
MDWLKNIGKKKDNDLENQLVQKSSRPFNSVRDLETEKLLGSLFRDREASLAFI